MVIAPSAGQDAEKLDHSHIAGGGKRVQPCEKYLAVSHRMKHALTRGPSRCSLVYWFQRHQIVAPTKACVWMSIEAFIHNRKKAGKNTQIPFSEERVKPIVVQIPWTYSKGIVLSKDSQSPNVTCYRSPFIEHPWNNKTVQMESTF